MQAAQRPVFLRAWLQTSSIQDWHKSLALAGATAAILGVAWYLFRESETDDDEFGDAGKGMAPATHYFKVVAEDGKGIAIRAGPHTLSQRTGYVVLNGELFGVSEVVCASPPQCYLKLADGRGWVFTHSPKNGHEIAAEISWEDAMAELDQPLGDTTAGTPPPPSPEQIARFSAMLETAGLPKPSQEELVAFMQDPSLFSAMLRRVEDGNSYTNCLPSAGGPSGM